MSAVATPMSLQAQEFARELLAEHARAEKLEAENQALAHELLELAGRLEAMSRELAIARIHLDSRVGRG